MDPKAGRETSEFWLVLAGIAAVVVNGSAYVNVPWDQFPLILGLIAAYTGGRSWVKATTAKAGKSAE
jgi:hypothetical protein